MGGSVGATVGLERMTADVAGIGQPSDQANTPRYPSKPLPELCGQAPGKTSYRMGLGLVSEHDVQGPVGFRGGKSMTNATANHVVVSPQINIFNSVCKHRASPNCRRSRCLKKRGVKSKSERGLTPKIPRIPAWALRDAMLGRPTETTQKKPYDDDSKRLISSLALS